MWEIYFFSRKSDFSTARRNNKSSSSKPHFVAIHINNPESCSSSECSDHEGNPYDSHITHDPDENLAHLSWSVADVQRHNDHATRWDHPHYTAKGHT